MGYFIGIHTGKDGSTWLEKVKARGPWDAYNQMERTGTNLLVLPEPIFKNMSSIEVPVGQEVKVS